jgi:membrane protein DedA with SNARE-associated domain
MPPLAEPPLVVLLGLIAAATLVSEDLACVGAGLMAAHGRIGFVSAVVACSAGIFFGDLLLFLAGRCLGRAVLDRRPMRWLAREERIEACSRWFARHGPVVILFTRFVPGARLPTYVAAGMLRTSVRTFALYFAAAVTLWTPLLVGASMLVGREVLDYLGLARRYAPAALVALGLGLLLVVRLAGRLGSFRGRRLLAARWRRLVRWEYWPPWATYVPVVAYVLGLGLRHRAPLLFTAANPAIEAGGLVGESKARILDGLARHPSFVACTRRIAWAGRDASERLREARALLAEAGLGYPVVLKPDEGQRGSGVVIARSEDDLRGYLERARFDVLVQEYVPGEEFGIFYYRYPDRGRGRIFSITEKTMPCVIGDGVRTLEELILGGGPPIGMAPVYLGRHAAQLTRVLAPGERLRLVELGTHCRGAVFTDGRRYLGPDLEQAIDRISRGYAGFYFGRYDVRAASVEDLRRARFKVIELNGVTSEATHIYDPAFGLLDAYRVLFEQWRIAFEIARQNRQRGHVPSSFTRFVRLLVDYRRSAARHAEAAT